MILAEELDAAIGEVSLEAAPPNDKLYGNPTFGIQVTGIRIPFAPSGCRCAKRPRALVPCWCKPLRNSGMSSQQPSARKTVKPFTTRAHGMSDTASWSIALRR
jgi:hypothetical protein